MSSAQYWCDHMRCSVQFAQGVQTACTVARSNVFIEVGARSVLLASAEQCVEDVELQQAAGHLKTDRSEGDFLCFKFGLEGTEFGGFTKKGHCLSRGKGSKRVFMAQSTRQVQAS